MKDKITFNAEIGAVLFVGPTKYGKDDYVVFAIKNLDNGKTYYYKTTSSTKAANNIMQFIHHPCVITAKLKETDLCNTLTYVAVSEKTK